MPPPPCMHKPNATIILKYITHRNLINIHASLLFSTVLLFGLFTTYYSFEYFSAINSKMNLKFEKSIPLVCRACQDESIDI